MLPESCMGGLSIFARRKGDMWVLAVMCGSKGRTIDVRLNFLGEMRDGGGFLGRFTKK